MLISVSPHMYRGLGEVKEEMHSGNSIKIGSSDLLVNLLILFHRPSLCLYYMGHALCWFESLAESFFLMPKSEVSIPGQKADLTVDYARAGSFSLLTVGCSCEGAGECEVDMSTLFRCGP